MTKTQSRIQAIDPIQETPDQSIDVKAVFNIDCDWMVQGFKNRHDLVPEVDETYVFQEDVTKSILAGFLHNRRVLIQGLHGTGKSTHIEQVAARLNYPCVRINLDSHISRVDLIGRDVITLEEGQQVTRFQEGILPWAMQNPCILVFDEYDAGRPDVMFVIQRILESDGKLTLLDSNTVIHPHKDFRLFATSNTVGLGDASGLYHGTQALNQGQIDRWHIVTTLNHLEEEAEIGIVLKKQPSLDTKEGKALVQQMVRLAQMTRTGFRAGDISTLMSPRTVLTWAENYLIFDDVAKSFHLSFLNRCDEVERAIIAEYYQRCFDDHIELSVAVAE